MQKLNLKLATTTKSVGIAKVLAEDIENSKINERPHTCMYSTQLVGKKKVNMQV